MENGHKWRWVLVLAGLSMRPEVCETKTETKQCETKTRQMLWDRDQKQSAKSIAC